MRVRVRVRVREREREREIAGKSRLIIIVYTESKIYSE